MKLIGGLKLGVLAAVNREAGRTGPPFDRPCLPAYTCNNPTAFHKMKFPQKKRVI
jgi:hypothetical protein